MYTMGYAHPPVNSPIIHVFEGAPVRVVVDEHGNPWFIAADVCRALDIVDIGQALDRLDDDERGRCSVPTPGGIQAVRAVTESGLYSLILGSRKPEAKRFKRWVTHEVLPSIRRTGSYGERDLLAALEDPATLRNLLGSYAERVQALEAENDALRPKATVYDRIMESDDTLGFQEACKVLRAKTGANQNEVRAEMFRRAWVRRLGRRMQPAAYGLERGYVRSRLREWRGEDGATRAEPELRITPKGLAKLAEIFAAEVA